MRPALIFLCALLALAACGKKGDPEPPQPDQFPHQYPTAEKIPETGNYGELPAPAAPEPQVLDPLSPRYP